MATINSAFNIAASALDADQVALNIVANNTANANTPGYTLEIPQWQEADSVMINGVGMGMGARVASAASQRSMVLERGVQQQTQQVSASSARLTALQQVEALFSGATAAGTDTSQSSGIGSDLGSLFNAFSALESDPSGSALRQQVLSAAGALAADFNEAASQLDQQRQSLGQQASSVLGQVNSLLQDVAQLNTQIEMTSPHGDAGALEDQRQQDLTSLSQLIGIRTVPTENNGLTVTTANGALLVAGGASFRLSMGPGGDVMDAQGNTVTADVESGGGQLGGILTARNLDIPQIQNTLDTLAYVVASSLNAQNTVAGGTDLNGDPGQAIFNLPEGATASNPAGSAAGISLALSSASQLVTAAPGEGSSDNQNVMAMADLASQGIVAGTTATAFYSDFVTTLGSMVSEVSSENTAQQAALSQLQNQIGTLSRVNLNDEAAQLETLEQAYQAASKLFTILNQVMTAALNLGVETTYS